MNSGEVSMEGGNHVAEAAGPSSSGNAVNHGGSMPDMVQHEGGYGLSDLALPMCHEAGASQSTEPSSHGEQGHPGFAGGIMRIAPAEVNVSCSRPWTRDPLCADSRLLWWGYCRKVR